MRSLLVSLLSKAAFARFGEVTRTQLKTDELKEIYRAIEVLHEQTTLDLSLDALILGLRTCYPEKKAEALGAVVEAWRGMQSDPALVESYFSDAIQKARAYEIAIKGIECFEGKLPYSDFQSFLSIDQVESSPEYEFVSHNLSSLLERQTARGGFKWRLNALNILLGHLPRKTAGLIVARPDSGKTGLLASEAPNFLLQTGEEPILWLANEEDPDIVKMRAFRGLYGVTEAKLYANRERYQADYDKRVGSRLLISGDTKLNTKSGLERAIKKYKPAIVIVDQLKKLGGFKGDKEDQRQGDAFAWFRAKAIQYNFAGIAVGQANSSADGKKYLRMTDIADSHTAIAGECDWILGIGKTYEEDDSRYLHTPKDKLPLSEGKIASKRHGYATVHFNMETGRYEDYK